MTDPSLFYSGIVAELYAPLRSAVPDAEQYIRFVTKYGQPALELGCGTGDPLLDLIEAGLEVEGLDSSADMLAKCREAAAARGLAVTLHEASMQVMDLGATYASIYLAGPTFNLLLDDDTALAALQRIRAHLAPGGTALVPLFVPVPTPVDAFGTKRSHVDERGRQMFVSAVSETRDDDARIQTTVLRYELDDIAEDHAWSTHWYTQDGFRALTDAAGLSVKSVRGTDDYFSVLLTH